MSAKYTVWIYFTQKSKQRTQCITDVIHVNVSDVALMIWGAPLHLHCMIPIKDVRKVSIRIKRPS